MIDSITILSVRVLRLLPGQAKSDQLNLELEDVVVKGTSVNVYFVFSAIYRLHENGAVAGRLYIRGNAICHVQAESAKEIDERWAESMQLPAHFAMEITDYLHFECESRGILAAYAMGFPPPVPAFKLSTA